jgi:hypothetical protein
MLSVIRIFFWKTANDNERNSQKRFKITSFFSENLCEQQKLEIFKKLNC